MEVPGGPDSFVIHSGREVRYADELFLAMVGAADRDEVLGRPVTDFVTAGFRGRLREQFDDIESGDAPALGLTVTLRTVGDRRKTVVAVSSPVEWDGAECIQTTFLRVADEDASTLRTVQDSAMDNAPVGITIADPSEPDDPLVYANDAFTELTGYSREEVLGRNCRFLQGPKTREEPVAEMRRAIEAEEPVTVELRNYRKDGSMFWNRVSIFPVRSPSGELSHYLGYQLDITDAKLEEQEKSLFEQHAEATEYAMFITDREGTIEYVNPAFERITGYSAAEAIGRTPRILKSGRQDEAFYRELWETITSGEVWEAELTNRTKDGRQYRVSQTIVPVTNDRDEITHFASIERDITDQKVRSQTLSVLNRVLRHNLRGTITVIDGYAELLESNPDGTDREEALAAIRSRTAAMGKIADRVDEVRRLSERTHDPPPWAVSHLETLLEEYRSQYPDADFSLTVDVADDVHLPDVELFEFALDEAVENAVKHAADGPPTVDIAVTWAEGPDHVRIAVRDCGPGIPDIERRILGGEEELPLSHGRGIGLWIMQWVATNLGGDLEVEDRTPRGTEVSFRLPTVAPPDAE